MDYRSNFRILLLKHAPLWLWVAAVLIVGQALVVFGFNPTFVTSVAIPSALLFALFLLRGSRIAWLVVLTGLVTQPIFAGVGVSQRWTLVSSGIAAVCLLVPETIRFVWSRNGKPGSASLDAVEADQNSLPCKSNAPKPAHLLGEVARHLIAWMAGWPTQNANGSGKRLPRSFKVLIWRLGICCVATIVLVGLTYEWQHGSGEGDLYVDIIARISWNLYLLAQISFIAAVVVAISRRSKK